MDLCSFCHDFTVILVFCFTFTVKEVKSQWNSPSESDCKKYCHDDCQQQYFYGSEFNSCVTANKRCDCGLSTEKTIWIIIGAVAFLMIFGYTVRKCLGQQTEYNRSTSFNRPIEPNFGVGIQPQLPQPVTTHYTFAAAPPVPHRQQYPYNPGFTHSSSIGTNDDPPSYFEVMRGNADLPTKQS